MKHIGKNYPIHDARAKAAGRTIYAGDMEVQNMLHVAVIFSDIPHGRVKSINTEKAMAVEGVVDIIHCFNTDYNNFSRYTQQFGDKLIYTEQVFTEYVRFEGDRIGAVIAKTEEIARKAVKLVEIEYEEYPYALNIHETMSGIIDKIHENGPVFPSDTITRGTPNTDKDLIEIETDVKISRINHMCMEPHACIAKYDPYQEELEVYSPNQSVFGIRVLLGRIFDISFERVRVVKATMGGSFGAKQEWMLEPIAAAAAIRTGRAVRLVFNRSECMTSTMCRSSLESNMKISYKPDGLIKNMNSDINLDSGAYLGSSDDYAYTIGSKFSKLYKSESMNCTARAITTNTAVSGGFRGWAAPEAAIILEHNVNTAAKKLGIDPLELRLKNLIPPQGIDIKTGLSVGDLMSRETLLKGSEVFGWYERKEDAKKFNAENRRYKRGVGIGACGHVSGRYPNNEFARVDMRLTEAGTVICHASLHDHGCGTITVFKMIAAEALGLEYDDIKIKEADTDVTPYDIGCYSSRTVAVIGRATYECAMALKEKMKEHFARLENVDINDVETDGKYIYQKSNRDNGYSFTELVNKGQKIGDGEIFANYHHSTDRNDIVCGAHFALVEVDTYTGFSKILDYVAVHDIGKALNREMCIAQTQGAVLQGSGAALSEYVKYRKDGRMFAGLKDYHLINSADAPNVRVELIEMGEAAGPYNAKSIGEACHVPVAACVMAAVNDALSSDIGTIPMTPDVIMNYLNERGDA